MRLAPYVRVYLEEVDGREAVTEALQYCTKLAMVWDPSEKERYRRIYDSFSQGRKVFRLFGFLPEFIRGFDPEPKDDNLLMKTKHFAAATFYLLDHYVWLLRNMSSTNLHTMSTAKSLKHRASLVYSILSLIVDINEAHSSLKQSVTSDCNNQSNLRLLRSVVKALHHTFRIWLTSHKLHLSLNRKIDSWSETKSGILGLSSAILSLIKKGLTIYTTLEHSNHNMDRQPAYRQYIPRELHTLPEPSNVKLYAQFNSFEDDDSHAWVVEDRGSTIILDTSTCGFDKNPARGEWFRIVGVKECGVVRPIFTPQKAGDFDPILFERALEFRRMHEKVFLNEIVSYAEPIEL